MRTFPVWRYGDDEQLLLRRPIDHTERKAFDKKASGFLERRGSAKGVYGSARNGRFNSRLKANTCACPRLRVVGDFLYSAVRNIGDRWSLEE